MAHYVNSLKFCPRAASLQWRSQGRVPWVPEPPLWTMKLATTLSKEEKRFRKVFHGISRVTMSARSLQDNITQLVRNTVPGWRPWNPWSLLFVPPSILRTVEATSIKWLFANQFEEITWHRDADSNSKANSPCYPVLIHHYPGYHSSFFYVRRQCR